MAPLTTSGPYYAIILAPGTLDTKGGPVTDALGRVVDVKDQVIPGLYAIGQPGSEAPVVVTATGGAHGGGARLAELGHALIERYRRAEAAAGAAAQREFRALSARVAGSSRGRAKAARASGRTSLRRPLRRSLEDDA